MKVTYTGKQKELLPAQTRKLDTRVAKIGKLVDTGKREQEAHVIYRPEGHLIQAEITVAYYDHNVVGVSSGTDQFTALCDAFDKLEKQVLKLRTKWRDTKRGPKEVLEEAEEGEAPRAAEAEVSDEDGAAKQRVFRVNHHNRRKPMTLEEAILEMEKDRDYVVYFDAETDKLSVLVRRRDGNFDLIED
jgi:putative sigma-54 modulation protein